MKYIYISIVFWSTFLFSQDLVTIKGTIKEQGSNDPLPLCLINAKLSLADTTSFATMADEEGNFALQVPANKKLYVSITNDGYEKLSKVFMLQKDTTVQNLTLEKIQISKLQDVVITKEKEQAQLSLDKRVFEVDKNLNAVGGTAEQLLKNIPSVNIDSDGNATMRNTNATIYIDGKPSQLSLTQIPSSQIESVEIISNPSAKYEAGASGGIINLVTKKQKKEGLTGTAQIGVGTSHRANTSLSFEYGKGKWGFVGMYNYNTSHAPVGGYTHRTVFDSLGNVDKRFDQTSTTNFLNIMQNGRLGASYKPNKFNTFSLSGNYMYGLHNMAVSQNYEYKLADNSLLSSGKRTTEPDNHFTNLGAEFEWKKTYTRKGKSISLVGNYTRNNASNNANWLTTSTNADGSNTIPYPEYDKISGNTLGNQYLAQFDAVSPINDSTKIEWGARSFTSVRNQGYFFNQKFDTEIDYTYKPEFSQDAKISETVNALYGMYSTKFKKKINFQAGLRVEQSGMYGKDNETGASFGYKYPSANGSGILNTLFPSLAMSKALNDRTDVGFSVVRKIGRPNWRQVFVGILNSDKFNITRGNPAIKPMFINTAEVNLAKHYNKWDLLSSAYFTYEQNSIKPLATTVGTDSNAILLTTFVNANSEIRTGLDNTFTYNILRNLKAMINVNVFRVSVNSDQYKNTAWTSVNKFNLTYRLPKGISLQANWNYHGKIPLLQGKRLAFHSLDLSLRKTFFDNKAALVFLVNDVFNTNKMRIIYDQPNMYQELMIRRDIRFFRVSFQYTFGNLKDGGDPRKKAKKSAGGADEGDFGM